MDLPSLFWTAFQILLLSALGYCSFLALIAIPYFQNHVIYLHKWKMTWFQDVNVPEQWGFLHNQVTPFLLNTPDGETLHAWHVLPLELYRRHEDTLLSEPSGLASDITKRHCFKLLQADPRTLLVLYLHGAGGTVAAGVRPQSYRACYDGAPDRIHTVVVEYRGFGVSTGEPSEHGLITDALTLADWATNTAGIPPERIVVYGQSLGTAVAIALAHRLALRPEPVCFAGMVLIAPFADVETLTRTYRVAGIIPLLSPLAHFPVLMKYFNSFIVSKWRSGERLSELMRAYEKHAMNTGKEYDITLMHAEDDTDIPWVHTEMLYERAVNAISALRNEDQNPDTKTRLSKREIRAGGWTVQHNSERGTIRKQIVKWGNHTTIQGYPVVSLAILKAFGI